MLVSPGPKPRHYQKIYMNKRQHCLSHTCSMLVRTLIANSSKTFVLYLYKYVYNISIPELKITVHIACLHVHYVLHLERVLKFVYNFT